MVVQYFDITTIKNSIEHLQEYAANWLLPAFVFAANDVGTEELVDMSKKLGTDQFLDRYFNGRRLELPPTPRGNNLLRPRLKGITWDRGEYAGDYMIRQDTKMWGNLFSSRGYREMRLQGLIEGEKGVTVLTENFQERFEKEIPDTFLFENFLVWLFAFEGFPDNVNSWTDLFSHLLHNELQLNEFKPPYRGRFKIKMPELAWPTLLNTRPSNDEFLNELAPKLLNFLRAPVPEAAPTESVGLGKDDPIYSDILSMIRSGESLAFLLAGPPGTGKTRYARQVASELTNHDPSKSLFLQFHPAIGYDDFIEGFRPVQSVDGSGIRYELAPRLFMNFANTAAAKPDDLFVVVIDELNRGDVGRIFGEALTYLEVGYRNTEFTLPVSGGVGILPKNLVIIATANPYDRSVTDLDDALLRRFWIIEMEPDAIALKLHLKNAGVNDDVIGRILQVFNLTNQSFPHGFGHAAFLNTRTVDDLAAVWSGRIKLPLRRAFIHDKAAFDSIVTSIEELLKPPSNPDAQNNTPEGI